MIEHIRGCSKCGKPGHYARTCGGTHARKKAPRRVAIAPAPVAAKEAKIVPAPVVVAPARARRTDPDRHARAAIRLLRQAAVRLQFCNRWMAAGEITTYAAKLEDKLSPLAEAS